MPGMRAWDVPVSCWGLWQQLVHPVSTRQGRGQLERNVQHLVQRVSARVLL